MIFPVLTERLRLRRLEPHDALRLAEYRSDPLVAIYQSWFDMTITDAYAFIDDQSRRLIGEPDIWAQIAIADRRSDRLIGDIGVCVKSIGQVAEIGFTLARDAQGYGYGTEALEAVIGYLFTLPAMEKIEAVVDARNAPAIKLVKRLGMWLGRTERNEFKGEICSEHRFVRWRDAEPAG